MTSLLDTIYTIASNTSYIFEQHSGVCEASFGHLYIYPHEMYENYSIEQSTEEPLETEISAAEIEYISRTIYPMTVVGAFGKYQDIINGEYVPMVQKQQRKTMGQFASHSTPRSSVELFYQKTDGSNTQIQYCQQWRSWKIIGNDGCTIAQMKSVSKKIALDKLPKIYWEVAVGAGQPFELQLSIQLILTQ